MAVILYHDDTQREQAERSKAAVMAATNQPVKTKILPLTAILFGRGVSPKVLSAKDTAHAGHEQSISQSTRLD